MTNQCYEFFNQKDLEFSSLVGVRLFGVITNRVPTLQIPAAVDPPEVLVHSYIMSHWT